MMYGAVPVMLLCSITAAARNARRLRRLLGREHLHHPGRHDLHARGLPAERMLRRPADAVAGSAFDCPIRSGIWQRRVPTQALEAVCAAVLLIVAMVMWRRTPFPGALFLLIMLSYASARLVLELARERGNSGRQFRIAYALSAIFVVISISVLAVNWR